MLDYDEIIAQLKPSPAQVLEATNYALEMITIEVHETHSDAIVLVEEGCVHIVSENDSEDLIFPLQYSFNTIFANKIEEIQRRLQDPGQ